MYRYEDDVVMQRLDDQISWYDRKSSYNQRMYKRFKTAKIVIAAFIPLTTYIGPYKIVPASLGALMAVLESLHELNQFDRNWTAYRATAEELKHEKFLFLSGAGPYSSASNPKILLAERVEGFITPEHSKWASIKEERLR